jgi:glycosyltransferase involved in cell wall biosynthesis
LLCRNLAIKEAKGKFITGLDDDDEFTKERVSLFIDEWDEKYSFMCKLLEVYNDGRIKKYYKEEVLQD